MTTLAAGQGGALLRHLAPWFRSLQGLVKKYLTVSVFTFFGKIIWIKIYSHAKNTYKKSFFL
jgi:hypothetical protein